MWFYLVSYPIIGAGIKYMDAAFDDGTVSKMLALAIAPLLAVLGWYAMMINSVSATILLAVLLGVFVTGKIDNVAHYLGVVVIAMSFQKTLHLGFKTIVGCRECKS